MKSLRTLIRIRIYLLPVTALGPFSACKFISPIVFINIFLNIFSFRVAILGYLRPEQNFESLEDLVRAIENDAKQSRDKLNDASVEKWRHDKFFSQE